MAIILIIGGIAIGEGSKQLMMAHETAAIEQVRVIHAADTQYFAQFEKYAENLAALGPPLGLIPENLAKGRKSGYVFEARLTNDGYAITAIPEKFGSSGRRSFYSDQTLVIRSSWTAEAANAQSDAIQ